MGSAGIMGWAHEMTAWFALTAGDYRGVLAAGQAGELVPHQAAESRRRDAAMRRAEAETAADEPKRTQLLQEAAEADALATVLDRRAAELETADETRAMRYAHTAETRAAADRAQSELNSRNVAADEVPRVTTVEWLAAHNEHMAIEDAHREATDEHDLADVAEQRAADLAEVEASGPEATASAAEEHSTETDAPDLRDVAASEDKATHSEEVRVPPAAEAADTIDRAQRALREVQAREAADAQRAAEEAQAAEMYRRHTVDTAEAAAVDADAAVAS
ncbi:hypothetical protein [Amycolatopsis sp. NPDC051372]|uniref:hypothetical protein n=1 Tax=unclassified Amycolatopsis TaxID=2618356 RepID=UPI003448531D